MTRLRAELGATNLDLLRKSRPLLGRQPEAPKWTDLPQLVSSILGGASLSF
jgi:hypothetical protein